MTCHDWTCKSASQNNTDRKSTRLNSSHDQISYAVFCLKKKKNRRSLSSDQRMRHELNLHANPNPHRASDSRRDYDPSPLAVDLVRSRSTYRIEVRRQRL